MTTSTTTTATTTTPSRTTKSNNGPLPTPRLTDLRRRHASERLHEVIGFSVLEVREAPRDEHHHSQHDTQVQVLQVLRCVGFIVVVVVVIVVVIVVVVVVVVGDVQSIVAVVCTSPFGKPDNPQDIRYGDGMMGCSAGNR